MKTIKIILGLILRFGLLILGVFLTIAFYVDIGLSKEISSWGIIFIFIGILVMFQSFSKKPRPNMGSVNGIGTTLYGKREIETDGSYIATKWVIFLLLPLFPISSYRVLPNKPKIDFITQITEYSRFEKVKINIKQVINVYLLIYGFIFMVFVLPFLF